MALFSMFLILVVAIFAALVYFSEPSKVDKRIHARMVALDAKPITREDQEQGILKEVTFSRIEAFDKFLRQNRFAQRIQLLIDQSSLQWTVGKFIFASLAAMVAGSLIGTIWFASPVLAWGPAFAAATVPYIFLLQKRNYRYRQFAKQLPEAIDLMSRGLRAGQALQSTLEMVAQEIEDPLGTEFRQVVDEQIFGLPFRESILNLGRRMQLPDLQFLITAILVQKETGGNLAQILDKTSFLIRERTRVEGQARSRTAQGRLTGWILCALPIVIFFGMNMVSPGYGDVLLESETGRSMIMFATVMMIIGTLVIRKIVTIKI